MEYIAQTLPTDAKIRGLIWAYTGGVIWGRSWGDLR